MKRKQRSKKAKTYFWRRLLTIILLFAASATVSFFYFKPKLTFTSPFLKDIESRHSKTETYENEDASRLYKSQTDQPEYGYKSQKDFLLASAEDIIKKYMRTYGVKLLDLYMDRNGTIYTDFSDELRKKFQGALLSNQT